MASRTDQPPAAPDVDHPTSMRLGTLRPWFVAEAARRGLTLAECIRLALTDWKTQQEDK
jgi:hypothetical protein